MDADADRDGFVNCEEFDFLCKKAAALPDGWQAAWVESSRFKRVKPLYLAKLLAFA